MNYSGLGGGSLVTALGTTAISGSGMGAAIVGGILPRTGGHILIDLAAGTALFLITWALIYTGLGRITERA